MIHEHINTQMHKSNHLRANMNRLTEYISSSSANKAYSLFIYCKFEMIPAIGFLSNLHVKCFVGKGCMCCIAAPFIWSFQILPTPSLFQRSPTIVPCERSRFRHRLPLILARTYNNLIFNIPWRCNLPITIETWRNVINEMTKHMST